MSLWCAFALAALACVPTSARAVSIGVHDFVVTPSTPQAGAHPDLKIKVDFCGPSPCSPEDRAQPLRDLLLNLPPGLLGDPLTPAQCPKATFDANPTNCPAGSKIGTVGGEVESDTVIAIQSPVQGFLYNVEPAADEIGRLGIDIAVDIDIFGGLIQAHTRIIDSAGQQVSGDLSLHQAALGFPARIPAVVAGVAVSVPIKVRNIEFNLAGEVGSPAKPYIVSPTSCELATTRLEVNSWTDSTHAQRTSSYTPEGCDSLPAAAPTIALQPDSAEAGQPSGYTFSIDTGFNAALDPVQSHIRSTEVVFPEGLTLSASAGGQLDSCSAAQLASNSCPANSEVGEISATSPFVTGAIPGHIYFGVPTPAEPYPVLFAFEGSGIDVALNSTSQVNEQTGQITAITLDQPQVPFSEVKIHLRGGDHAVLANPNRCGSYHAQSTFTLWSGQAPVGANSPDFEINQGFGQGCPQARGFNPTLGASLSNASARAFTHLRTIIERADNNQQLTALRLQTPPGLTATLAMVPHCPRAQALSGDCGDASKIGDITVQVGAGNTPVVQRGKMFVTEALNAGDVIGFSFVIPAKAGPIDLGTVVTTSGVKLSTGGGSAITDTTAIPTIFKGVPIPIRKIDVDLNSDRFLINPSNCDAKQFRADLFSDEGARLPATAAFQITGCERLPFAPKLTLSTDAKGQPKYNNQTWHPAIRAILTQGGIGEAAIRSSRVAIPDILRPNIAGIQKNLCQGATLRNCPVSSRIGEAVVETPLLSEPLRGYMYLLQEPGKILPKIALALDGPVSIDVDSRNAIEGIRTVNYFENLPDVPLRRVDFFFYGGKGTDGILNAFSDLCAERSFGDASFAGHNGKQLVDRPLLRVDGCPVVARMSIKRRRLRVSKRGIVRLRMRCASKRRCFGDASLTRGRAAKSAKRRTLGRGRVKIKSRKTRVVKIKLKKKWLRKVRRRKKKGVRATVRVALERQPVVSAGRVRLVRSGWLRRRGR